MTEYRTRYMSPRREDYVPHIVLPKVGSARPLPRSRSFLSFDVDPETSFSASEYRLRFPNHHPKRPYCFHAQPSHVFDFPPSPPSSKPTPRLESSPTFVKDTEYQERFPNYRAYVPVQDLVPPHLPARPNMPSATQLKKERMSRSQYFQELVTENEKFNGGQRSVGVSEHRMAFQWPYRMQPAAQEPSQSTLNMYEPPPRMHREVFNSSN